MGRRVTRTVSRCAFLLASVLLGWTPVASQEGPGGAARPATDKGTVGVFAGRVSARQLWGHPMGSKPLNGLTVGAFVEAQTPVSFLAVRAEVGYAAKGTILWNEAEDPDRLSEAKIRVHYLIVPIHGKVTVGAGPVSLYVFGGPTLDLLLASRCAEHACPFVRGEKGTVLNAAVGAGVGFQAAGVYQVGFEGRLTEGLGDAHLGEVGSARNRSTALLVRIGRLRRGQ